MEKLDYMKEIWGKEEILTRIKNDFIIVAQVPHQTLRLYEMREINEEVLWGRLAETKIPSFLEYVEENNATIPEEQDEEVVRIIEKLDSIVEKCNLAINNRNPEELRVGIKQLREVTRPGL